jgi:hypothetical protein
MIAAAGWEFQERADSRDMLESLPYKLSKTVFRVV